MTNFNINAKQFNHELIIKQLAIKLNNNVQFHKDGNFTYIERNGTNLGFIEKIPVGKYPYTIYLSFFDIDKGEEYSKDVLLYISGLYKEQKAIIDNNKEGYNICIAYQNFFGSEII